ncbi:MAG: hypothetical protein HS126_03380 [Anaerolineales bacterium]|nr:hypothetical protein [Anaerolineales bacterium]
MSLLRSGKDRGCQRQPSLVPELQRRVADRRRFLAAVQTRQPQALATGREAIKMRLWKLVSLVDACPDEQLEEIVTWLDDLETALTPAPESAQ